ncbi:hypothetical protein PsorP6_010974 [Peronosclerospora sorghi]|uniref:Uncharacterized protein n=1 Tax=Peronosclerospora sorghi TaxID=230839 RepID=A0ACC0VVY1_9STRA|nr:hypothetical protein PsorP6_010974 [Peronosclerospora sorghi]
MTDMLAIEAAPAPRPPDGFASAESTASPNESDAGVPKASETKTLADFALDSAKWTLHSDHELHTYLQRYSTEFFARTKDLENQMRDLAAETDAAHVRLKNTLNEFLMLSNNQFVENRVYDEEQEEVVTTTRGENEGAERHDKEQEQGDGTSGGAYANGKAAEPPGATESIVNKYRSALEMGMEALKLFVLLDDDEDDKSDKSDTSSHVDTVLDIYNERPLPFIIGTREFLEDETLGLGAAPDEEASESESDSSDVSSYSSSDSVSSGSSRHMRQLQSRSPDAPEAAPLPRRRADSEESGTSGLFGRPRRRSLSEQSDSSGLFGRPSAPASALAAQNASRHGEEAKNDSEASHWTSERDEKGRQASKRTLSGVEAALPLLLPASEMLGFDSSDDESDVGLFGSVPPRGGEPAEQLKQPSSSTTRPPNASMLPQQDTAKQLSSRRSSASSDSSSDGDRDLFGSASGRDVSRAKAPAQGIRLPFMMETSAKADKEESEEASSGLVGRGASATRDETKATTAPPASQSTRRLDFSDESSDDDETSGLFGAPGPNAPSPATLSSAPSTVGNVPRRPRPTYSDSSSDDDESGSLFGIKAPTSSARAPPSVQPAPGPSFVQADESDESDGGGLFGIQKPTATPDAAAARSTSRVASRAASSESESEEEEGLFGISRAAPSAPLASTPSTGAKPPLVPPPASLRPRHMSSDEESDEWSDDESDLFGGARSEAAPTVPPPGALPPRRATAASPDAVVQPRTDAAASRAVPPPLPTAAARMRAVESEADSDSDWDGDGGLFGPRKK